MAGNSEDSLSRISKLLETITSLKIEPVDAVFFFTMTLKIMASSQLVQDKICRNEYGLEESYCSDLGQQPPSADKNAILGDSAIFGTLQELTNVIPAIFMSMFIGSWCD